MHYYPHHIGDFIRDTARLNDAQSMAYLRLLWVYYESESPIPNDIDAVAFKIGANASDVHQILSHFFFLHDDGFWHQARCDKEILEYRSRSEKAKKSANARWSNANAMRSHNDRTADAQVSDANHKPVTNNQEPNKSKSITAVPAVVDASGGRRPPCPHREIIALYHELLPANPQIRVEVWSGAREAVLRTRWNEKPERQNLDWWRRFFAYIGYSSFLTGRAEPSRGRERPFTPNLEWIMRPSNFAKIFEGQYHSQNEQAAYDRDFKDDSDEF